MATELTLRNKVAAWLVPYIGLTEGDDRHKAILKVFNDSKLCTRYTMTVKDAWCATAVSAAFIGCGLSKIFPCVECSCARMLSLAKSAGIWVEDDAYIPKVGDVVLYDWQDSGTGDNTGTPDHVGIVYTISGSTMKIIEGNKTDTVGYRNLTVNGKYIRGFITPKYASMAESTDDTSSSDTSECEESVSYNVGDTVEFMGTKHYVSANSTAAKNCSGGQAKITQISKNAKHPYHLVHTGAGCTVYGWVDAADIRGSASEAATDTSYAVGDKVLVTGTLYGNGNGTGGTVKKAGATMYVVNIIDSGAYPYCIGLAAAKGGKRQGWAKSSILSKA